MAIRKPRGYSVNRPPYAELSEGIRPNVQTLPLEAWTGLPPVRIDEQHHDPIVIDAGTAVGVATGTYDGKLFPCVLPHGATLTGSTTEALTGTTTVTYHFNSDDDTWGLPTTDQTVDAGIIKPIGIVYQPIYSFYLEQFFSNYKRTDNVGIVTQYVVQVPCVLATEHLIRAGDEVMIAKEHLAYGRVASGGASTANLAGRYQKWDGASLNREFVIGRCLKSFVYATGGTGGTTTYQADTATLTVTTAAKAEFPGLDKVQTVPGMKLAGSGTGGVPGHLLGGIANGDNEYRALTILIRI